MFILALLGLSMTGCLKQKQSFNNTASEKELLIYCGTTMIKPMTEIAKIIEEQENCKVIITKGGSGNLFRSIKVNKVGDLYLPGDDSYIKTGQEEGLISETALVGYNKAAIMVQKGNPLNINSDLENFLNPEYHIHLGNPDTGSIGRETKHIFDKKGIYKEVIDNTCTLSTDSKDLGENLKAKKIDLTINWYAVSVWPEYKSDIDAIAISDEYAAKKKLVLGLLTTAKEPEIAKKFMEYASSKKGRTIFNNYGLFIIE